MADGGVGLATPVPTGLHARRPAAGIGRMWDRMPVFRVLIAIGAGLALADASVVTLALPPMLIDLDTTVEGVAAVIGVYTLVLALALPGAAWLRRRVGDRTLGAGGFAVFAVAGALCATPESLAPMLAFRALQARRRGGGARRRLRAACAAAGCGRRRGVRHRGRAGARRRADPGVRLARDLPLPGPARARGGGRVPARARRGRPGRGRAAGGAGDAVGAPQAAAAADAPPAAPPRTRPVVPSGGRPVRACCRRARRRRPRARPVRRGRAGRRLAAFGRTGAYVALAALSAALTGVLFLLVLLLVSGWSLEPLAAAAAVSVLPLAAFAGARIRGDAAMRASAGCALVGAGVLALAVLPGASCGLDRRPAGARRPRHGHGAARARRRAAARAHAGPGRHAALGPPRGDHARAARCSRRSPPRSSTARSPTCGSAARR